jgi:hypothetical protein
LRHPASLTTPERKATEMAIKAYSTSEAIKKLAALSRKAQDDVIGELKERSRHMPASPTRKRFRRSRPGLPSRVRVGPFDYRVEEWPSSAASAREMLGECDRVNLVIRIRTDIPRQQVAETFLHEILHAIWVVGSMYQAGDDEEKLVTKLSINIFQVMRDNPDVMDFITARAQ